MITWSLDIAGTVKTLAEWRVHDVRLHRRNLAPDTLTFTAPRAGFDDVLCAFGATVRLLRDGVVWFSGTSQTTPEFATGQSQEQLYTIASPMRWLAENVFQQLWYNGTVYTSHIIFVGNVGNNIKAVLDYAIARGANLQYNAADLAALTAFPPTNEFTDKFCDQAILDNLQFAPDTVAHFDYTTTPPTLRFQQRPALTAVSLRMASHTGTEPVVSALNVSPRPDLQRNAVKIIFEITSEIDGVQYLVPSVDVYPPGATGLEDRAFNAVVPIQGRTIQNITGQIECAQIDTASVDWWKEHVATLRKPEVRIVDGPTNPLRYDRDGVLLAVIYDRELLPGAGSIAPWMESGGSPLDWQEEVIKATFDIEVYDVLTDEIEQKKEQEFSVTLITTNAPDGVSSYSAVASADSGDPVPTGLAQSLHGSLSELHYEGRFDLAQDECDAAVNLGQVVNLLGARTEHQTMRALVQEVIFDIDDGRTSIICGPPAHLSLSDVLALLQRFRVRRRYTNPLTQQTGELGSAGGGDLEFPRASGTTNSLPGASVDEKYMVKSGTSRVLMETSSAEAKMQMSGAAGAGSMNLLLSETQGLEIRFRRIGYCENGVTRSIIVPCSEVF